MPSTAGAATPTPTQNLEHRAEAAHLPFGWGRGISYSPPLQILSQGDKSLCLGTRSPCWFPAPSPPAGPSHPGTLGLTFSTAA